MELPAEVISLLQLVDIPELQGRLCKDALEIINKSYSIMYIFDEFEICISKAKIITILLLRKNTHCLTDKSCRYICDILPDYSYYIASLTEFYVGILKPFIIITAGVVTSMIGADVNFIKSGFYSFACVLNNERVIEYNFIGKCLIQKEIMRWIPEMAMEASDTYDIRSYGPTFITLLARRAGILPTAIMKSARK